MGAGGSDRVSAGPAKVDDNAEEMTLTKLRQPAVRRDRPLAIDSAKE